MKLCRASVATVAFGMLLFGSLPGGRADTESNPYGPIIERNAFGLKPIPPPPPPPPPPEVPAPPAATVKLTGITSILTSTKALLEITEPGAGKTASKPILAVGEAADGVEVLAIDVAKSQVRIRTGNIETNITFDVASAGPATAAAPAGNPRIPPQLQAQAAAQAAEPVVVSSRMGASSGRSSVVLSGGSTAPVTPNYAQPNYAQPNNAFVPNGVPPNPLSNLQRTVRTAPQTPTGPAARPMSREEAMIILEANRAHNERRGGGFPPLPPTPISPPSPGGIE